MVFKSVVDGIELAEAWFCWWSSERSCDLSFPVTAGRNFSSCVMVTL